VRIAQDLDWRFDARETDLALDLRQGAAQVQVRTYRKREGNRDDQ
jgi:hypothetical protein